MKFSMMKPRFFLLLLAVGILPVRLVDASDLEMVLTRMEERVGESVADYNSIAARIEEEKVPLVRDIHRLENENIALRADLIQSQTAAKERSEELERLKTELEAAKARSNYVQSVFNEYLGNFESKLHVAEDQRFKSQLTAVRKALDAGGSEVSELSELYLNVLDLGLSRHEDLIGGYQFDGRSIDGDGNVLEGRVGVLGPVAYFSSEDGSANGLLLFHSGTLEPGLLRFAAPHAGNIQRFMRDGKGELPLDASLGNAIALHEVNVTLREHIRQGGLVGYAILCLGAVALLFSLIILVDLSRYSSVDPQQVQVIATHSREREIEEAQSLARNLKGSMGEMIRMGIDNISASAVFLEEVMLSVVVRKKREMERFLPFLAITAVAAPLMGLLGTVVGMIKTFALITVFGTGDPKALSSGISEALVTTEIGLIVAIIMLLLHALFARVIKSRLSTMEHLAFDFVNFAMHREAQRT